MYESLNLLIFFYQLKTNQAPCCNSWARGMWSAPVKNLRCVPGSQSTSLVSSLCVYVCVLFFQSVIVIPLAQSVIAVMAQDFVYVRRALQGLNVRSVYPAICGTMAANVSRTTNLPMQLPPQLCLSLLSLSLWLLFLSVWFLSFGWKNVPHMRRTGPSCPDKYRPNP